MRQIKIQAFVSVIDPKTGRIIARGKSKPRNLILNNFGVWLAGLIRTPVTGLTTITLKDDGGADRTFYVYHTGTGAFNAANTTLGTNFRVGSSVAAPARTDYTIGAGFPTAPESGLFGTGSGSYAAGVISFSAAITAGGSGTVNECGFYGRWFDTGGALRNIMLFHDLISPGVSFTPGQIITVSCTITL